MTDVPGWETWGASPALTADAWNLALPSQVFVKWWSRFAIMSSNLLIGGEAMAAVLGAEAA